MNTCDKITVTSNWEGKGTNLIVFYVAENNIYHYFTEKTFSKVTLSFVGGIKVILLENFFQTHI